MQLKGCGKMKPRVFKGIVTMLIFFMLFAAAGLQPAHAVDKSRVFIWLMFVSGLGSTAAGAILQGDAENTYDEYLHTASQAEMNSLIDDYDRKNKQSIIASRAGLGLVIGAVLLSLVDAAHIPIPEAEKKPVLFSSEYGSIRDQVVTADTKNGDFFFAVGRKF